MNKLLLTIIIPFLSFGQSEFNSFYIGDPLPDAPILAARGKLKVGVKTIKVVNPNQIDILNSDGEKTVLYDRPLKLEIWYPASLGIEEKEEVIYDQVMGNFSDPKRPLIPFKFKGRALRNAVSNSSEGPYPLIIVSHGYTGSRLLFTYLTENLASKGYVVVSIDHTDSTFKDANNFNSTLLNRSLDDLFVLNEMARLSSDSSSFLKGLVNTDKAGLIGYSMGGYGAVNIAGGGYSEQAVKFFTASSKGNNALEKRKMGNPDYINSFDNRFKAIVAMAPWGMENGFWNAEGLKGIKIPTLFVAGGKDDISGYEKGVKAIYDGAVNSERYMLTYLNARHNIAPNPPTTEVMTPGIHIDEYLRYADSVWDQRRINNVNQHFITAFMGVKLKNNRDYLPYLDAKRFDEQDPWEGFLPRTSVGLEFKMDSPAQ
jgi:predicted dienelactone hydrolase